MTNTHQCPTCKGKGYILNTPADMNLPSHFVDCSDCGGKGTLSESKEPQQPKEGRTCRWCAHYRAKGGQLPCDNCHGASKETPTVKIKEDEHGICKEFLSPADYKATHGEPKCTCGVKSLNAMDHEFMCPVFIEFNRNHDYKEDSQPSLDNFIERFISSPPCGFCHEHDLTPAQGCGCWELQARAKEEINTLFKGKLESLREELKAKLEKAYDHPTQWPDYEATIKIFDHAIDKAKGDNGDK